ncbi:hypothetical protein V5799_020878 [Amblyomma americanum]|uniref:Uncharacterized protein n=1 Tax=Amblyomma americanum TaxID=6943 RepID=A0AAQ4ESU9_AMBAM
MTRKESLPLCCGTKNDTNHLSLDDASPLIPLELQKPNSVAPGSTKSKELSPRRHKRSPQQGTAPPPRPTRRPLRLFVLRVYRFWPYQRAVVVPFRVANYTVLRVGK